MMTGDNLNELRVKLGFDYADFADLLSLEPRTLKNRMYDEILKLEQWQILLLIAMCFNRDMDPLYYNLSREG